MAGINQIQVKPQIGLTFANALRSIVRQDPDVIMIGEIRDLETAQIAVQSALTGHLVLSTLHTNDAASDGHPPARHGRGGLPADVHRQRHPRPAPGAHALRALQGAVPARAGGRGGVRPAEIRRRHGHHPLSRQGLRALRPHRLHRSLRHHGNAADDRPDAQPGDAARQLERAQGRGAARRHVHDVRGRHAQGAARRHDVRGSPARHRGRRSHGRSNTAPSILRAKSPSAKWTPPTRRRSSTCCATRA